MVTRLTAGRIFDPASGAHGQVQDLYVQEGRFVDAPPTDTSPDQSIDLSGMIVMAGAIDMHTHIGGGKVAMAKMLLPEQMREHAICGGVDGFLPTAEIVGRRYLEMGYTACFEPAVIPWNARQAHAEMADTPYIDTGGYCLLGNEDCLLRMLRDKVDQSLINDYVAWMVAATQCIAVKVVNAGGISAFKFNQRHLDVDTPHPHYGVTPGQVIRHLARAVHEIGLAHPLHVHCSNLGVAGNIQSTLKTIEAADGFPIHLTHVQFHSYGDSGTHGFSSAAEQIVDAMQRNPNVTIDVGQVMFGQTVTISADTAHQFQSQKFAKPRKSLIADVECQAGCGVVPFQYRKRRFVNALQWAIGLELFLMVDDPSRVFLTTDHPNGGPFTTYPHLMRLLCDRGFRDRALDEIHPDAAAASQLRGMDREYSINDIAMMTRLAPANILGLSDRGRLTPGAVADVVAYREDSNIETMFASPAMVIRNGKPIIQQGRFSDSPRTTTLTARPTYDVRSETRLREILSDHGPYEFDHLQIDDEEMQQVIGTTVSIIPTDRQR